MLTAGPCSVGLALRQMSTSGSKDSSPVARCVFCQITGSFPTG